MKRIFFIAILFLAFASVATSQYYSGALPGLYSCPGTNFVTDTAGNIRFLPHDLNFTMSAGAFAGSNFHGDSWFGTSVSPALSYNVAPRLRISAGITLSQGSFGIHYPGYESILSPMGSYATTTSVFVRGDYIVSNKLMISGAAFKYFSPFSLHSTGPGYSSPEGEGYVFNINYRPAKNFEINASIGYGNSNGMYQQNPYFQPGPFTP